MIKQITIASLLLLFGNSTVHSADIVREISHTGPGSGNFVEINLSLGASRLPLVGFNDQDIEDSNDLDGALILDLNGRLEYKNFFGEFLTESFNDVTLGHNLFNSDKFSLDFIGTQMLEMISRNDQPGLTSIEDRENDFNLGLRGNWFSGDNMAQLELVHDVNNAHDGLIGSIQYGKQYQFRNWHLYSLGGVRYFSSNVIDHFFGVSEQESTADLPIYRAGEGFFPTLQLGAAIPLNEKWIFRATAEYAYLPGSVRDSPLAQGDDIFAIRVGFSRALYPW